VNPTAVICIATSVMGPEVPSLQEKVPVEPPNEPDCT